VITIEQLSKRYKLGQLGGPTMLREALVNVFRRPLRRPLKPDQFLWALRDVSFDVPAGEILGVIGRNGSGKSTLLKILSKITRPTSGMTRVTGRVASLLEVGTGFHEELTGRENIYLSGTILGMAKKRIDAKLEEIIAFAGIEQFIDTPIKRYSSGMTMRLGFSVAAHLEAEILLVDEVLAVGDGEFQRKCLQTMSEIRGVGRTVLFVSHNLAAVENLCTRAIWLDNGLLRGNGRPKEIIREYMSTFGDARAGEVALDHVLTRRGSGEVRFSRIEFLTMDRRRTQAIASGDGLVIRLRYNARCRIERPVFGLEIYTNLGTLVTQIHTYNSGVDVHPIGPGDGYVDVELPDLNLAPGRYYVSLYLTSLGYVFYDVVDHCAIFDVDPSCRYGLNRALKGDAIMCLPCNWVISDHPV
jgi:lipopolysaccharide transport system ATP-binding protein